MSLYRKSIATTETINNTEQESTVVAMEDYAGAAVLIPAAMTGAMLDVQGSHDGENFYNIYDKDGTQIQITALINTWRELPPAIFAFPYIRFVSAAAEGAARTLEVVLKS